MKYISIKTLREIVETVNLSTKKALKEGAITKSDMKFSIETANVILATAEKLSTVDLEKL